jgi:hypothetical protein
MIMADIAKQLTKQLRHLVCGGMGYCIAHLHRLLDPESPAPQR